MWKRILSVSILALLLTGCEATLTNLTPQRQVRNADNLYRVEVSLTSHQQSLRWETLHPQILVGNDFYEMRPTPLMTNRWEGLIPVPPGTSVVRYRYKFDYQYNAIGTAPQSDSAISKEYTLHILDQQQ